jgi:hypothetical protein
MSRGVKASGVPERNGIRPLADLSDLSVDLNTPLLRNSGGIGLVPGVSFEGVHDALACHLKRWECATSVGDTRTRNTTRDSFLCNHFRAVGAEGVAVQRGCASYMFRRSFGNGFQSTLLFNP